jgi:dihydrofolate reductase
MRKIIVSQFVTVDNVVEAPADEPGFDRGGWAFRYDRGPDGHQYKADEVNDAGALLLGRKTYEAFAAVWPAMREDTGIADKMNSTPKFVVSSTLKTADWANSTILDGDAIAQVRELKSGDGGDILLHGSIALASALAEHDLVDGYRLMVFPVVLGAGRKLWGDTGAPADLSLVEARSVGDAGVVVQTYERKR